MSNGLDQDQDRHFVDPDLVSNSFQKFFSNIPKLTLARKELNLFACLVFFMLLSSADIFFQNDIFQEHYQSIKRFVGPDLVPNYLQSLSADYLSCR